jgi:hypothetical protein
VKKGLDIMIVSFLMQDKGGGDESVKDACYKFLLKLLTFRCYISIVNDACYMTGNQWHILVLQG